LDNLFRGVGELGDRASTDRAWTKKQGRSRRMSTTPEDDRPSTGRGKKGGRSDLQRLFTPLVPNFLRSPRKNATELCVRARSLAPALAPPAERFDQHRVGSRICTGEVIAMRDGAQCAFSGFAAAALFTLVALEVSVAAMPAARGVDPATVDRTRKGDFIAGPGAAPSVHTPSPKLPDGCIAASAWQRGSIYTAEIAGRCVV
jgi:hypothetical protein